MIKLRKMTVEEVNNKPFLINQIYDLYHYVEDSFFEYVYKGEVRWLYTCLLYTSPSPRDAVV